MAQSLSALSLGDVAVRQLDGLFSLNDLHRAAGSADRHMPFRFMRLGSTKALIAELSDSPEALGSETPEMVSGVFKLVKGSVNPGTYACRELVIAYAAWISAAFHLKVIRVFLASATPAREQPTTSHPAFEPGTRWNAHIDAQGRMVLTPALTPQEYVAELAKAIASPTGGGWGAEHLLPLAEAIHTSLARDARRIVAMQQAARQRQEVPK